MAKFDYSNVPVGSSKSKYILNYYINRLRTWYKFHIIYPWVKYNGFVRVMSGTSFAKFDVKIGNRVQFGKDCKIAYNVHFGNNILMASRVSFVGKKDHGYDVPEKYIWDCKGNRNGITIIEDDVWIGLGVIVCGPVKIGRGSIVAAGSVITKDIPPCEIWGGIPAKKISNRFLTEEDTLKHYNFLSSK